MASRFIKFAAVSGATALVLGMSTGAPAAWGVPPATCGGRAVTILGTDGDDSLTGTAGDDVVSLGSGNDHFEGRRGDDVVCGGPGRDVLRGGEGDDTLFGEDDTDILVGELGDDLVDGGNGPDTIYGDLLGGPLTAGMDGADELLGGPGDDRVESMSGDGFGGGGADTADGGDGVDLVSYESSPIGVIIDVPGGVAHGVSDDAFTGFEQYRASNHGDTLIGGDGPDVLDGLDAWGDDVDHLIGRAGDDTLTADQGTIDAGPGNDTYTSSGRGTYALEIRLGSGRDRAEVTQGRATSIHGGRGQDSIDVMEPDYGKVRAVIHAGPGTDLLSFAGFRHAVRVDVALGKTSGKGLAAGFNGVEQVDGTARADALWGSQSPERLRGLAGTDVLHGRGGPDVLIGGRGRDIANGGRGHDTCIAEIRRWC